MVSFIIETFFYFRQPVVLLLQVTGGKQHDMKENRLIELAASIHKKCLESDKEISVVNLNSLKFVYVICPRMKNVVHISRSDSHYGTESTSLR